jgi:chromosome segregation ATPase
MAAPTYWQQKADTLANSIKEVDAFKQQLQPAHALCADTDKKIVDISAAIVLMAQKVAECEELVPRYPCMQSHLDAFVAKLSLARDRLAQTEEDQRKLTQGIERAETYLQRTRAIYTRAIEAAKERDRLEASLLDPANVPAEALSGVVQGWLRSQDVWKKCHDELSELVLSRPQFPLITESS